MTVDFDFHMGAAFQNSNVVTRTRGPGGQTRTFSDQCEAGILAQTIGEALRFRVAAPIGIGAKEDDGQSIRRPFGAHVELEQKVCRKYAAIPYHHVGALSGVCRPARGIEGRRRHA
jgi:hypothetical protein